MIVIQFFFKIYFPIHCLREHCLISFYYFCKFLSIFLFNFFYINFLLLSQLRLINDHSRVNDHIVQPADRLLRLSCDEQLEHVHWGAQMSSCIIQFTPFYTINNVILQFCTQRPLLSLRKLIEHFWWDRKGPRGESPPSIFTHHMGLHSSPPHPNPVCRPESFHLLLN